MCDTGMQQNLANRWIDKAKKKLDAAKAKIDANEDFPTEIDNLEAFLVKEKKAYLKLTKAEQKSDEAKFAECRDKATEFIADAEEVMLDITVRLNQIKAQSQKRRRRQNYRKRSRRDAEPVNAQSISDEFNYCENVYNQTIPDIIKFNKLLLYVSGEAKDIIKRYIVTADNFEIAYAALKAYYGNEVRIGTELHKQLRTIAPPANDVKSLRRFMNDIASITAQMMAMNRSVE
ncbi:hypothetical protein L596_010954 [Steinernema carpocapsae]|uniref:Uncharacterized protein n=1 Tax=Steinernema carpocapsae TaxID=34508 RepID=A0A4V6A728_STECR|nr:hypothetical protein L596_010954 [Steinernema carpocapsae]